MKTAFALVLLLSTFTAHAGGLVQFSPSSILSPELKQLITEELKNRCPEFRQGFEVNTLSHRVVVDNGLVDEYYHTQLILEVKYEQNIFENYRVDLTTVTGSGNNGVTHHLHSLKSESFLCQDL